MTAAMGRGYTAPCEISYLRVSPGWWAWRPRYFAVTASIRHPKQTHARAPATGAYSGLPCETRAIGFY